MTSLEIMAGHCKDTFYTKIGLCAQHLYINHSRLDCQYNWKGMYDHFKGKMLFLLTAHNICILSFNLKDETTIYIICNCSPTETTPCLIQQ